MKITSVAITNPEHQEGSPNTLTIRFDDDTSMRYKFGSVYDKDTAGWKFMIVLYKLLRVGTEVKP